MTLGSRPIEMFHVLCSPQFAHMCGYLALVVLFFPRSLPLAEQLQAKCTLCCYPSMWLYSTSFW